MAFGSDLQVALAAAHTLNENGPLPTGLVVGASRLLAYANPPLRRLFGGSPDSGEVPLDSLLSQPAADIIDGLAARFPASRSEPAPTIRLPSSDDGLRTFEVAAWPVQSNQAAFVFQLIPTRLPRSDPDSADIPAARETPVLATRRETDPADQRRDTERAKTEFLAMISHELRTPLTAIIAYAELMVDDSVVALPQRERHQAEQIRLSAAHLHQLVRGHPYLHPDRAEAGEPPFHARGRRRHRRRMRRQCPARRRPPRNPDAGRRR